jgi:hypothetical protein
MLLVPTACTVLSRLCLKGVVSCLADPSFLATNLPVVADFGVIAVSVLPSVASDMNLSVAPERRGFLLHFPPVKTLLGPTPRAGDADVEPRLNLGDLLSMLSPSVFSDVALSLTS